MADYLRLWLLLAPAIIAIVARPGFVTQDGPAHVYNAQILREAFTHPKGLGSFLLTAFDTRLEPLPNWAGHATLIGLLSILPARAADQVMILFTLLGPATLCVWLARTVSQRRLSWPVLICCGLCGLNWLWLLGFYSFLLGSMAFLITLGFWWQWQEKAGPRLALGLGLLMVAGYLCHPISLTLTVMALAVLCLSTKGSNRVSRIAWTIVGLSPLVPLGLIYRRLMGAGGELAPTWAGFSKGFSLSSLVERLLWIDPITIGRRSALPFASAESRLYGLATPVFWMVIGIVLTGMIGRRHRREPAQSTNSSPTPWVLASSLTLALAFLAPDSMGPTHGHYLTQRIVWLGLMLLVPALATFCPPTDVKPFLNKAATACLSLALALQTAFVCDYSRESNRLFHTYTQAVPAVGQKQRLAGLFLDLRGRFRANPLVHLDCWLGVDTQNVVWSNYEAAYYYFPVRLRPDPNSPPIREFEAISIMDDPNDAPERLARWTALLERYHPSIDRLVLWGNHPDLEEITAIWYIRTLHQDPLQVWVRRNAQANRTDP